MPKRDLIVVGASAGGVEALMKLARALPAGLPAAVCVVLHLPTSGKSLLPQILRRAGSLPVIAPENGHAIEPGNIYVAPPDHHMLICDGSVQLTRGPKENGHRPGIDPLFRSAARAYGPRTTGVILSGTLDDGTAGLLAIKAAGGVAVAQEPHDALFSGMPASAIRHVPVDYILPVTAISNTLVHLATELGDGEESIILSSEMRKEADVVDVYLATDESGEKPGHPSAYSCPDCQGVLWEVAEGDLLHYRCRIGHAFSGEGLLSHQSGSLENALWAAVRSLEEKASLAHRLAARARERDYNMAAQRFHIQADEAMHSATMVRNVLMPDSSEEKSRTGTGDS